jgi:L-fuconolactonase
MLIVDSQVHIWAANSLERPWLTGAKAHCEPPLSAQLLLQKMDEAHISRALLVPPSWDQDRNDLVLKAAHDYPDRFAAMGRFDLYATDAQSQLAHWLEQPGMRGMRLSFTLPAYSKPYQEGQLNHLFSELERLSIPLMALIDYDGTQRMAQVAQDFPQLKIALCHLGLPTGAKDEAAFAHFKRILPLARYPNIMMKASALPAYTREAYPFYFLHPYLKALFETFGPQRIFWGSDLGRLPCTYKEVIELFTQELQWLSQSDLEGIMGKNVCDWLGWSYENPDQA